MKRVYIIHGWGGFPEEATFPWLKSELESQDFQVTIPEMPDTNNPKIEKWIPFLQNLIENPDKETFLIGHSIGAQAVLRYIESLPKNITIGGAVLLAGYTHVNEMEAYGDEAEKEIEKPWLKPLNWEKIRSNCSKFIAIFSDNDLLVPLSNQEVFKENLNAEIIIEHNKGHFSTSDNIKELPSLLSSVLKLSK